MMTERRRKSKYSVLLTRRAKKTISKWQKFRHLFLCLLVQVERMGGDALLLLHGSLFLYFSLERGDLDLPDKPDPQRDQCRGDKP